MSGWRGGSGVPGLLQSLFPRLDRGADHLQNCLKIGEEHAANISCELPVWTDELDRVLLAVYDVVRGEAD